MAEALDDSREMTLAILRRVFPDAALADDGDGFRATCLGCGAVCGFSSTGTFKWCLGGCTQAQALGNEKRRLIDDAISFDIAALRAEPPRREYLLTLPGSGAGIFARGEVGLLAARGGSGKSYALYQLGVCIATGSTWLGAGRGWATLQKSHGRVLYVAAEEDESEARRRVHYSLKAQGLLSDDELTAVVAGLDVLPYRGHQVRLTNEDGTPSDFAIDLRVTLYEAAKEGWAYTAVFLDPLSRFAGFDTEKDNAAATAFVQACESLSVEETGRPNVLVAAHNGKGQLGRDNSGVDAIRGASAIVDGVRWACTLTAQPRKKDEPALIRLRVVKVNNAAPAELWLTRVPGCEGAMEACEGPEGAGEDGEDCALKAAILAQLRKAKRSGNELVALTHSGRNLVLSTCAQLEDAGKIQREGRKWALVLPVLSVLSVPPEGSGTTGTPPFRGVPGYRDRSGEEHDFEVSEPEDEA